MNVNPINFRASEIVPNEEQLKQKKGKNLLLNPLNDSYPSSSPTLHFISKKTQINDASVEIETVLEDKGSLIERFLKEFESTKSNYHWFDLVLELESFGSSSFRVLDTSADFTRSSAAFLERVLPLRLLSTFPLQEIKIDRGLFKSITASLDIVDHGAQGLQLFYQTKILHYSEELLNKCKKIYLSYESGENTKENLSTNDLNKIKKMLTEWEADIKLEKKNLKVEKQQFHINNIYYFLECVNVPFCYLPKGVFAYTNIISSSISWILSGIEILTSSVDLYHSKKELKTFDKWTQTYKNWQNKNLPKGTLPISNREHETIFFQHLKEAKDLFQIKDILKTLEIELNPSIITKDQFFIYLQNDPNFRLKIILAYLQVQRTSEMIHKIGVTSHDLLKKRIKIMETKKNKLKPEFQTIDAKVHDLKKVIFVNDMQHLMEKIKNSNYTPLEIKEHLQKWNFYDSKVSLQNHQLLLTLEKIIKNQVSSDDKQQILNKQLQRWMENPTIIDKQFQTWYQTQSQDDILTTYIDHQETIEITVKNALKQIVQQKHQIERRFFQFKFLRSEIEFSVAIIALAISIVLAVLGLFSIPFGGAGILLLIVSLGSSVISLGLLGASYYQFYHEKPHTASLSFLFYFKKRWAKINSVIHSYNHHLKTTKLLEVAKLLYQFQPLSSIKTEDDPSYQKALSDYHNAKKKLMGAQEKVNTWNQKIKKLESEYNEKGWQDFADQTSLQIANNPVEFNTLRAFKEAFQACDLKLLSEETKTLLELQLGIDIEALQAQINHDPESIKKILQEFFLLDNADFLTFIKKAKILKRDLIQKIRPLA